MAEQDDDILSADPSRPIQDPDGNPVAQNAIESDRQAKLQDYLKKVREARSTDLSDSNVNAVSQDDRANVANGNILRSTLGGIANALNFTGITPGGTRQASAATAALENQNQEENQALNHRIQAQQVALNQGRQDRNDAQAMMNQDDTAAIRQQQAAQQKQQFETKQAQMADLNDPNSQRSQIARQLAKQYMPQADFSQATAAQLEPQLTELEKAFSAQEGRKARVQSAQEAAANRYDSRQLQISEKQNQADEKTVERLGKDLQEDVSSGRSAYGVAAKKVQGAQAAKALIAQAASQPGGLDSRQMRELATSVNTLIGGSSAVSQIEELIPSTAGMAIAKAKEYITGQPAGTNTQAFTQRLADTIDREQEVAQKQISANQGKAVAKYKALATRRPDDVADVLDKSGIDVAKQFKDWGLPVPTKFATQSATAPAASKGIDLDSINAELARRGHN